jgi:hypothetical protein
MKGFSEKGQAGAKFWMAFRGERWRDASFSFS